VLEAAGASAARAEGAVELPGVVPRPGAARPPLPGGAAARLPAWRRAASPASPLPRPPAVVGTGSGARALVGACLPAACPARPPLTCAPHPSPARPPGAQSRTPSWRRASAARTSGGPATTRRSSRGGRPRCTPRGRRWGGPLGGGQRGGRGGGFGAGLEGAWGGGAWRCARLLGGDLAGAWALALRAPPGAPVHLGAACRCPGRGSAVAGQARRHAWRRVPPPRWLAA
jgi:hypothetical protein